jgi:riboflavin kinase/FMN adenylyltransferase
MKIYRDISELPAFKQTVVTIGSFDGLHIGHQKIINRLKAKARENDYESVVITFSPHPREILSASEKDFRLLSVDEEKIELMRKTGIDHLVIIPFSIEFSQMHPGDYIENFLIKYFNPAIIIIGYDHRYGLNRSGDLYLLKQYSKKYAYRIIVITKQEVEDNAISSTIIRESLLAGDIETARLYMNYNYSITGKVVDGEKIGRKLGYPTINLLTNPKKLIPKEGVYAVRVLIEDTPYDGMMYIGSKPTFGDHYTKVVEIHLFDFFRELYGAYVKVEILDFIRGETKFESAGELQAQLADDKLSAQELIKNHLQKQELPFNIAVIILNYNGKDYLEEYLPSVISNTEIPFRLIIADNGSTDDSIPFVKKYYPEIEIHELEHNYGFAEGYNRVIKALDDYKYIVLLNSDVETDSEWLSPIIDLMEKDRQIGVAQPKILSYDAKNKFEYAGAAGGYLDLLAYPFCRGRIFDTIETDEGQYDDNKEVFWASGAAMVIRKKLFTDIGGFDTRFFAHQEEIDLCWRIKQAGYKVYSVGSSKVYHLGGGTLSYVNPHKTYLNFRNNLMMMLKNDYKRATVWKFPVRLVLDGIAAFKFLLEGRPKAFLAILRAHMYIYANTKNILDTRMSNWKLIKKSSIGSERMAGKYSRVIIWDYFIEGRKKFTQLPKNEQ